MTKRYVVVPTVTPKERAACRKALDAYINFFADRFRNQVKENKYLLSSLFNVLLVVADVRPGYWFDHQEDVPNMLMFEYLKYLCILFGERHKQFDDIIWSKELAVIIHSRTIEEIPLGQFECLLFANTEKVKQYLPLPDFDSEKSSVTWARVLGYPATLKSDNDSTCRVTVMSDAEKIEIFVFTYKIARDGENVKKWINVFQPKMNQVLDIVRNDLERICNIRIGPLKCLLRDRRNKKHKHKH